MESWTRSSKNSCWGSTERVGVKSAIRRLWKISFSLVFWAVVVGGLGN